MRYDSEKQIKEFLASPNGSAPPAELLDNWEEVLPALIRFLRLDQPIQLAERAEIIFKAILNRHFCRPVSGEIARSIARCQKQLSFILKYKSYGIKASTPLGYSIFLLEPHQGFSFQQHITHKTEVFHILKRMPGGFVFLCDFEEWQEHYRQEAFVDWMNGKRVEFFDSHAFEPAPGDVVVISQLGTVHTALGCLLEEYATVSTDMVDRLHDQNINRAVPTKFTRSYAESHLKDLKLPTQNRLIDPKNWKAHTLKPTPVAGGYRTILEDSFLTAARYVISPEADGPLERDAKRATSIRIYSGSGALFIADEQEVGDIERFRIDVAGGDVLMVAPGVFYRVSNEGKTPLQFTQHQIDPSVAFPEFQRGYKF